MPFSVDTRSGQHHDMRDKLVPFNHQSMKFNVSTNTSPHVAILVTDGWIQMKVFFVGTKDMLDFTFCKACSLHFHFLGEYSKLERVETMSTRSKININ